MAGCPEDCVHFDPMHCAAALGGIWLWPTLLALAGGGGGRGAGGGGVAHPAAATNTTSREYFMLLAP
jgi:hypothetical protein